MKSIVIVPVGENLDALFVGLREFPTERVILLVSPDQSRSAVRMQRELERFKVPVQIKQVQKGNVWEAMFRAVGEIKSVEENSDLLINVSSGNRNVQCAATSAAYVNGIKAFAVEDGEAMLLPVLKFSYYTTLTEKKMEILQLLSVQKDCCASLEELSRKTKLSLPLVSYHINGNLKSEGLRQLGLVETTSEKGRTRVSLSLMGRLLIKGYVR